MLMRFWPSSYSAWVMAPCYTRNGFRRAWCTWQIQRWKQLLLVVSLFLVSIGWHFEWSCVILRPSFWCISPSMVTRTRQLAGGPWLPPEIPVFMQCDCDLQRWLVCEPSGEIDDERRTVCTARVVQRERMWMGSFKLMLMPIVSFDAEVFHKNFKRDWLSLFSDRAVSVKRPTTTIAAELDINFCQILSRSTFDATIVCHLPWGCSAKMISKFGWACGWPELGTSQVAHHHPWGCSEKMISKHGWTQPLRAVGTQPSGLQRFTFGYYFNQSLDNVNMPMMGVRISIGIIQESLGWHGHCGFPGEECRF